MAKLAHNTNLSKSILLRFQCTLNSDRVSISTDQLFEHRVEVNIFNLDGISIHRESGAFFSHNNQFTLKTELCDRGIYIVKILVDGQRFVETLYCI